MSALRTSTVALGARARAAPFTGLRFASTDASASGSASPADVGSSSKLPMTWTDYLAMRKKRRTWSTVTTIPSSIGGLALGLGYFANLDADPTQLIFGLEPMIVYGMGTVAAGLGGYLVGPSIGNAIFSATHPKLARGNPPPLDVMDREFFERLKKHRADPSKQSVTNPSPDFYGEKIVSLGTYRRWLRDQQAFMRKASHGVPGEEEL